MGRHGQRESRLKLLQGGPQDLQELQVHVHHHLLRHRRHDLPRLLCTTGLGNQGCNGDCAASGNPRQSRSHPVPAESIAHGHELLSLGGV